MVQAMDLRFLFLDLNSYFASVEQQLKPDLRGEPLIVVPVLSDATSAIAASYEAKAYGIKTGTNVGEAKRICPGLKIVEANHRHYVEYHHRIRAAMEECIPVTIVASIDEFGAELMKNEREPKRATEIAHAIKASIRRHVGSAITCSIGIAPNRYLAKVAADMQKPDGLTVLEQRDIAQRLLELVPQDLPGIGPNMKRRLEAAGVTSMAQLLALAPKQMRAIWHSVAGEQMYYRLRGMDIPLPETTTSSVGHSHVLAPEYRPPARAQIVAMRLTLKAGSRLRRKQYMAGAFDLSVRLPSGLRVGYTASFSPACDNHQFIHVLQAMWAQLMAEVNPQLIKKVSVTLHRLTPAASVQPDLLAAIEAGNPQRAERLAELSRAMDRVNEKYGKDTLVMGFTPSMSTQFSGTKIAFTRVPDVQEFHE